MFRRVKDAAKKLASVKGYSPEQFRRELCAHLHRMGIDAEAVSPGSPEDIGAGFLEEIAGCVKVKGRSFDLVQSITTNPSRGPRLFSLDFVVRGNVAGLEKRLEAEATEEWKGFVRRGDRITDVTWEGGHLADLLNGDRELKDLLIHANGYYASPWIRLDRDSQCIRIGGTLEPTEGILGFTDHWKFPSPEYVEACDRIARHVRTIL